MRYRQENRLAEWEYGGNDIERLEGILHEIEEELYRALRKFPPFASPHEGWAIIKEEEEELWDEIKRQHDVRSGNKMRREAIQVAAMAVRFVLDLYPTP